MSDDGNSAGDDSSAPPTCPSCGTPLEPGFSECWSCGSSVSAFSSSDTPLVETAPLPVLLETEDDPLVSALVGRTPMQRVRRRALIAAFSWAFVFIYPFVGVVLAPLAIFAHLMIARWTYAAERGPSYRPAVARFTAWLFLTIATALTLIPFLLVARNGSRHAVDDAAFVLVAFGGLWALLAEAWLVIALEHIGNRQHAAAHAGVPK